MSAKNVVVVVGSSVVAEAGFINWIQGSGTTYTVAVDQQTDYITVTDDAAGGGGNVATDTIFNSKGDLVVGSGSNTADRLGVGTDGQVLAADSAQTLGIKWATLVGPVTSIKKTGSTALTGDVTLTGGSNVTLTQSGQDISIASSGGGGSVATDTIFDAAGDLAVGTGADTASKLTKGTAGQFLQAGSSTLAYADVFIPVAFAKSGTVAVTTEGDSPGPLRWYNDTGRTLTFAAVRATSTTGPAGSTMIIDVNVDGTTIMTGTKVVIADGGNTVKQTTFSTATIADGHYISINIDQVGSGTAGSNLVVTVWLKG